MCIIMAVGHTNSHLNRTLRTRLQTLGLLEWTEADGTIYRLNAEGKYDVIPLEKKKVEKVVKSTKKPKPTKN